jgi:hypothetical protein
MIFNYLEFNFCYSVFLLAESQFYHQPNGNALDESQGVAIGLMIYCHFVAL